MPKELWEFLFDINRAIDRKKKEGDAREANIQRQHEEQQRREAEDAARRTKAEAQPQQNREAKAPTESKMTKKIEKTKVRKPCPSCGGSGQNPYYFNLEMSVSPHCSTCYGAGTVNDE